MPKHQSLLYVIHFRIQSSTSLAMLVVQIHGHLEAAVSLPVINLAYKSEMLQMSSESLIDLSLERPTI